MNDGTWDKGDQNLQAYLNEIPTSKGLERSKEQELGRLVMQGDEVARAELVEANLPFVVSIAQKYQHRGLSLTELISAGNLGMMTAADHFDADRGVKFISYAVWWVKQAILQALAEDVRTVHLPGNRIRLLNKIARAAQSLNSERADQPALEEIAASLQVPIGEVHQILLSGARPYSLDQTDGDYDESNRLRTLADTNQEAPDAPVLRDSAQRLLSRVLNRLEYRERRIIHLYFGLDGSKAMTLEEIGALMDITRERVRQIKKGAIQKLRHPSRLREIKALGSLLADAP
ncbi:MAG: sigma-70 family RNA polymerase sigma factor [Candidatus Latescibacteria bacterium]|nr:sigma-70 family RNA polymerase sigma factor [Candidatus Latescibacterota bacterium]